MANIARMYCHQGGHDDDVIAYSRLSLRRSHDYGGGGDKESEIGSGREWPALAARGGVVNNVVRNTIKYKEILVMSRRDKGVS